MALGFEVVGSYVVEDTVYEEVEGEFVFVVIVVGGTLDDFSEIGGTRQCIPSRLFVQDSLGLKIPA